MRIPHQFNEDNLYRRNNRHQNRRRIHMDARRILQMMIALGLVLIMMRQASKPEIYEPFFGTPPTELDSPVSTVWESDVDGVSGDPTPPIDPATIAKVVDGTVWRSGDFEALYLFLDESTKVNCHTAPLVGVLSLLQQPEVFRNQPVRVRGRVVRSQSITAGENDYGITRYWQLWIRPHDGVERPLVVIASSVPSAVAAIGTDSIDPNGPQVMVAGRFLKRLAYRSTRGADLAPVIVGRLVVASATPPGPMTDSDADSVNAFSRSGFWASLGVATIIGISLASLAMWRTSVASRRMRQLRSSRQKESVSYLHALNHPVSDASAGDGVTSIGESESGGSPRS